MLEKGKNCNSCVSACWHKNYAYRTKKGLNKQIVQDISKEKQEPEWMLNFRLKALECFESKKLPQWGPDLSSLNINNLYNYLKPIRKQEQSWENLPKNIKQTFETLGLLDIEKKYLAGLGAQYESEVVYHNLKKEWEELGIIFTDTDTAVQKYPEIFKRYFATVVSFDDNKFSALNSAVWSGGSFIYIPKGINVSIPLQTYYRINSESIGQFERTLIIADEGSSVSYIEGCTAPVYTESSLHSAVVEIVALQNSKVKYYTIQNWPKNIYNLVTKRAVAHSNAVVEWIDSNIGSSITMKYPAVILKGKGSKASVLSLAVASDNNQIQDSGAKAIHLACDTSSRIISKSISSNGGRSSFRGFVKIINKAQRCKSYIQCDSLLMDDISMADAYPYIDVAERDVDVGHEARISRVADEQIFYLMSRGIKELDAQALIINGFISSFTKELPVEYAMEINRLVETEIKGRI